MKEDKKEGKSGSVFPFKFNKVVKVTLAAVAVGVAMLLFNLIFLYQDIKIFSIANMIAVFVMISVPLLTRFAVYKNIKIIESAFPKYLRDLAENVDAGMTLSQAVRAAAKNDYATLTPYVKEIAAKMSWGIPFEHILIVFAQKTGSPRMMRNVQTIVESYKSGGTISTILVSVAQSLNELENIKKERSASVYSQTVNGYIIYVIFLGVMIGLSRMLTPSFGGDVSSPFGVSGNLQAMFSEIFRNLILIQGFFAGLAIGKISDGTFIAGIKHAVIMTVTGYTLFVLLA